MATPSILETSSTHYQFQVLYVDDVQSETLLDGSIVDAIDVTLNWN